MSENILSEEFSSSHVAWFWGILAESTREKGQRMLNVYIPDLTPMRNGDIFNKGSITKSTLFNVITQAWETREAHVSKTVLCEYLGFESSREVPDMYKGQQVLVMTYGCTDRWFWIPLERDDYVKPFEHVMFRCADKAIIHKTGEVLTEDEERLKGLTPDNTYFLELDTKYKKHILLSTAGTDSEKYRYFMKMDAKEHTIEIWDGLTDTSDPKCPVVKGPHNTIKIESDPEYSQGILKGRITLQNEAGATLMLEGEDVKLVVPRDLTVQVGRNNIVHVNGDEGHTVDGNRHLLIKKDYLQEVLGKVKKEVVGFFRAIFRSTRSEYTTMTYVNYVLGAYKTKNLLWKNVTDTTMVNTVGASYLLTSPTINITGAESTIITGGTSIISYTSQALLFTGDKIITTKHILGCCACPGH